MARRGRRATNRPDAHRREVFRGEAREHVLVDALLLGVRVHDDGGRFVRAAIQDAAVDDRAALVQRVEAEAGALCIKSALALDRGAHG